MAGRLRSLTPAQLTWAFAALAGLIVLWNAAAYPAGAGYDAASHREYADFLIQHHRLPFRNETPEYYSPPLYYLVAGAATWVGKQLAIFGDPHKLGQLLNVPAVVGTVLLVGALARLLWPERRWLAPAAAGFVALSPVLTRTASMFNPESVDLFVSTLCLFLAARILLRRDYGWRASAALGVALGCGEMVRQFSLWTLAVVVLAFAAALVWKRADRRALTRSLAVALAATAVIALPWYVYRAIHYANPIFDRPQVSKPLWDRRPVRFYVDPGLPDLFTKPYRPNMVNLAWPETYADMWGDWYGVFAWNHEVQAAPSPARNGWLIFQNVLGLVPTALAIGGWLLLLAGALRRRDPARLLVSLLPLAGLAGYLFFTVSFPTKDGDVLKPTYMLSTLGAWALCFAWLATRLGERRPRFVTGTLVLLAVLDLPFVIYKGAVGLF
ncbi:MAG TPA: phospholipid carrier-dependent glycosyltransferase [Gaiellaceae bacterium]